MEMIVPVDLLTPRRPGPAETYFAYLSSCGLMDKGFAYEEIVRGDPRHQPPPLRMWTAMVPTLALAIELRRRMLDMGASGLSVAATYRPSGGARDSRHKHNAAIDLDLLPSERRLGRTFARVAAELWAEHAHLRAGVGTYAPDGALWTNRIHLDTGYRFRAWQGLPGGGWAAHPAAIELAYAGEDGSDAFVARADEPAPADPSDRDCVRQGASWRTK